MTDAVFGKVQSNRRTTTTERCAALCGATRFTCLCNMPRPICLNRTSRDIPIRNDAAHTHHMHILYVHRKTPRTHTKFTSLTGGWTELALGSGSYCHRLCVYRCVLCTGECCLLAAAAGSLPCACLHTCAYKRNTRGAICPDGVHQWSNLSLTQLKSQL